MPFDLPPVTRALLIANVAVYLLQMLTGNLLVAYFGLWPLGPPGYFEPWQVSVRFNRLGTIGYYCDQHGDLTSGMRGAVTVIDRIFVDGFE